MRERLECVSESIRIHMDDGNVAHRTPQLDNTQCQRPGLTLSTLALPPSHASSTAYKHGPTNAALHQ